MHSKRGAGDSDRGLEERLRQNNVCPRNCRGVRFSFGTEAAHCQPAVMKLLVRAELMKWQWRGEGRKP